MLLYYTFMGGIIVPIYEYQCQSCGKNFEHMQKITDEPLKTCTFCNGKVKKLVSNCSFQLKGTGWYVTDYAKKSDKGAEKKKVSTKKETKEKSKDTSTEKKASPDTAVNQ